MSEAACDGALKSNVSVLLISTCLITLGTTSDTFAKAGNLATSVNIPNDGIITVSAVNTNDSTPCGNTDEIEAGNSAAGTLTKTITGVT